MLGFFYLDCYSYLTHYCCFVVTYISMHLKALWLCSLTRMKNIMDNSSTIYRSDLGVLYMLIQWLKLFGHFQIRGMEIWSFAPGISNSYCFDQFVILVWVFSIEILIQLRHVIKETIPTRDGLRAGINVFMFIVFRMKPTAFLGKSNVNIVTNRGKQEFSACRVWE